MANEHDPSREAGLEPEIDLDKTDRLPILEGALFEVDIDVEDDAVPLDHTAAPQDPAAAQPNVTVPPNYTAVPTVYTAVRPDHTVPLNQIRAPRDPTAASRGAAMNTPSPAQSMRSAGEHVSRQGQGTEYEALNRAYHRALDAESALAQRVDALAADLATARSQAEQALHDSERYQGESRALRSSLAAREANSKSTAQQLDSELQAAHARAKEFDAELRAGREMVAALNAKLERGESELNATRSELGAAKTLASSYLDLLRTREWRRGFDQNLFRELDAQVSAARNGQGALESERDRLRAQVATLEAQLTAQSAAAESERSRLTAESAAAERERSRLAAELTARQRAIAQTGERDSGDELKVAELLDAAQRRQTEHAEQIAEVRSEQAAQIAQLQSEAQAHEEEMTVLLAHLQEARRPIGSFQAEDKHLTEELAAKTAAFAQLEEEHHELRAVLERAQRTLEERDLLIRRLERSDTNPPSEVRGSVPASPGAAAGPSGDRSAELIRVDGERPVTYVLSRRMRIGRAAGCELQIDVSSVSRHHALVLVGPRDTIIEDLNSTNGVLVNGRKVTRQTLCDGDAVTIGETQFRYLARAVPRSPDPDAA
jgi:hypothetical protein